VLGFSEDESYLRTYTCIREIGVCREEVNISICPLPTLIDLTGGHSADILTYDSLTGGKRGRRTQCDRVPFFGFWIFWVLGSGNYFEFPRTPFFWRANFTEPSRISQNPKKASVSAQAQNTTRLRRVVSFTHSTINTTTSFCR
jgi:hypothetical protein